MGWFSVFRKVAKFVPALGAAVSLGESINNFAKGNWKGGLMDLAGAGANAAGSAVGIGSLASGAAGSLGASAMGNTFATAGKVAPAALSFGLQSPAAAAGISSGVGAAIDAGAKSALTGLSGNELMGAANSAVNQFASQVGKYAGSANALAASGAAPTSALDKVSEGLNIANDIANVGGQVGGFVGQLVNPQKQPNPISMGSATQNPIEQLFIQDLQQR